MHPFFFSAHFRGIGAFSSLYWVQCMNNIIRITISCCFLALMHGMIACSKSKSGPPAPPPTGFRFAAVVVFGEQEGNAYRTYDNLPTITFLFAAPINRSSVAGSVRFRNSANEDIAYQATYKQGDSAIAITPVAPLAWLEAFTIGFARTLQSTTNGALEEEVTFTFKTPLDQTPKFPVISEDSLLTLVQQQTFKYFWDFAHPVSGLARERNTSGDIVTTGGSGFGMMALPVAVERGFITRAEALARMQQITGFLLHTAQRFHGAYPHWLNGATGAVVPFSAKDNGADLVETSFLVAGLLTARQYFNSADPAETALRKDIDSIWYQVEWDWFRRNDQQVLYWHWSPYYGWEMDHPIKGWNECLITYVLAAASPTHSIPATVYTNGWAGNGDMLNGGVYYGLPLPLGESMGGPLFFAHYSFLGIDPNGLTDPYANYFTQNRNHALINHAYCKANPKAYYGYSDSCWGLTASDIPNGYTASSPTNDVGVIAPTAALSSFPYTPLESMKALKYFYYVLGDKLWKEYGFIDAFSLHQHWFANSFLAIDQGPIIVMIENYRSGLVWNLFMSCPEVKAGMTALGFQSPRL